MKHTALAAYRTFVEPAFRRPEFVQTAALCLREGQSGPEVLLVTSLSTKRWILPKGWPMESRTLADAALQEAWEEAGVRGTVDQQSLGNFSYRKVVKRGIPVTCRCEVFRVDVDDLAEDWPEKGQRRREWVSLREAAKRVSEPELKAILTEIQGRSGS